MHGYYRSLGKHGVRFFSLVFSLMHKFRAVHSEVWTWKENVRKKDDVKDEKEEEEEEEEEKEKEKEKRNKESVRVT